MSAKDYGLERVGNVVALSGAAISIYGSWVNSIDLNHNQAMWIWAISNPLMALWALGYTKKWWNGGISGWSLVIMYVYYIVTNSWALMHI